MMSRRQIELRDKCKSLRLKLLLDKYKFEEEDLDLLEKPRIKVKKAKPKIEQLDFFK